MTSDDGNHLLLLGRDHAISSEISTSELPELRVAAAISMGHVKAENEDAVLAISNGSHVLLAVADGHHGDEASHGILQHLATWNNDIPRSPRSLRDEIVVVLDDSRTSRQCGTTLVVAVFDIKRRELFGLSWGDSTAMVLSHGETPRVLTTKRQNYVRIGPGAGPIGPPNTFGARTAPDDLILLHTDGVDECHYGRPASSINPRHVHSIWERSEPNGRFPRTLVEVALSGLPGMPGGEDNVGLVTLRV